MTQITDQRMQRIEFSHATTSARIDVLEWRVSKVEGYMAGTIE